MMNTTEDTTGNATSDTVRTGANRSAGPRGGELEKRSAARRRPSAQLTIGAAILALAVVTGIVAPLIVGTSAETVTSAIRQPADSEYWFGTDALGRDILLRTLSATGVTLLSAACATLLGALVGVLVGAGTAAGGIRLQRSGQRLIDLMMSFPPIIIALVVSVILQPGTTTVVLAIAIALAPQFARLANSLTLSVISRDFVGIARGLGLSTFSVLRRHVLPNIAGPLMVLLSVCLATSVVALSGLSFLGLGVQSPAYDWGSILAAGLRDLYTNPLGALGPGAAILVTGLAAGLLGDAIADRLRPRSGTRSASATSERRPHPPVEAAARDRDGSEVVILEGLNVSIGSNDPRWLVENVSLDIRCGEVVGLVGESGSGKSMTAMALARLLPPTFDVTATSMRVASCDLADQHKPAPRQLALELGIVFQDPSSSFNPAVKLGRQLTEVLRVHRGIKGPRARELAVAALREMHVTHPEQRMDQYPHELSGGMRQRAMIAMALLTQPAVLIADEPTTALDVTVQAEVLKLMRAACRNHGTAILFISHDLTVVSALCDRIHVMQSGRVVETLTPEQLRGRDVQHPYTQQLLAASAAHTRSSHARSTSEESA